MFGLEIRKKQKVNEKVLVTAINTALDNWMSADNVDALLAETGKTRQQLLDAVMADDEVISCREDIEGAIAAATWRIWGEDVSEEVINRLYKMVRRLATDFADLAILAKFNGYAVAEYIYQKEEDGFISIKDVLSKDGELDLYTPNRDGSVSLAMGDAEIEINQTVKFLVLKNKAVPARPAGELMIIRAYPAVALRKRGWAYAGQFIARYSQPYVVGKQGGDSYVNNDTRLSNFTSKIFGFINGGAAGIGKDDVIEMHQLRGDGAAFELFERLGNRRIQKLILGRVKTSELTSGSRAAQETDDQSRQNRVSSYLLLMAKAVQHAIDAVIAVNNVYGMPVHAPQGLWFEYEEQFDVDVTRAERDKLYCDTGQMALTEEYLTNIVGYEKNHIRMLDTSDTMPTKPQTPPLPLALSQPYKINWQLSQYTPKRTDSDTQTKKEQALLSPKIQALLSACDECNSYAEFDKKLAELELPDDGLIADLANELVDSFSDGLAHDSSESSKDED